MNIRFLTVAEKELDETVEWYNHQVANLGARFLDEFNKSIFRVAEYPYSCEKIESDIRRCLVNRFPYGIIYRMDEDEECIVIIAVAHLHRKPGYWHDRVL